VSHGRQVLLTRRDVAGCANSLAAELRNNSILPHYAKEVSRMKLVATVFLAVAAANTPRGTTPVAFEVATNLVPGRTSADTVRRCV
jgi:hypothetical protein